ncbi:hypothetical protein MSAN_01610200 [Mycena sanguinolenta]|uniref:Uncharacterized protein n=1 Tax=Mycena sanguinolenta TaxID=230812 RepID=A0A8H6Y0H4_9AGAR|nr:hypothetical protein MSAN_01610200 [Mycena sanguinolenta]
MEVLHPHSDEDKIVEAAHAASQAQKLADDLKVRALAAEDEGTKARLLAESKAKEVEARKHSRRAHRLASGGWQGGARGAGVGATIGVGLGAVVGTLVGTIASIPTTGLGFLVGVPVGWIHGPWIGGERKEKDKGGEAEAEGTQHGAEDEERLEADRCRGLKDEDDADMMADEQTHRAILEAVEAADKLEQQMHEDGTSNIEEPAKLNTEKVQSQPQEDENHPQHSDDLALGLQITGEHIDEREVSIGKDGTNAPVAVETLGRKEDEEPISAG